MELLLLVTGEEQLSHEFIRSEENINQVSMDEGDSGKQKFSKTLTYHPWISFW